MRGAAWRRVYLQGSSRICATSQSTPLTLHNKTYHTTPTLSARSKPTLASRTRPAPTETVDQHDDYQGMQPEDFEPPAPVPKMEDFEGYELYKEALESGAEILPADLNGPRRYGEVDENGESYDAQENEEDVEPYSHDLEEPDIGFAGFGSKRGTEEATTSRERVRNPYPKIVRVDTAFDRLSAEEQEAELERRRAIRDAEAKRRKRVSKAVRVVDKDS